LIILGGGLVKHHICNANLMRNGADYAVFINTGQEYDGSDAGARPDEAVSWGKLALQARSVKVFIFFFHQRLFFYWNLQVFADATIVFPLLVSQTFAKSFVPK
jgi:deoxyhypusine synthase